MTDTIKISRELLEFFSLNARGIERDKMAELRALLAQPPEQPGDWKWIACAERLPENGEIVFGV